MGDTVFNTVVSWQDCFYISPSPCLYSLSCDGLVAFPESFPASCTVMAGIDPTIPFASEGTGGNYLKEQMDI